MNANAFLTGSRKYGTPRLDSDYDLCVLVSDDDFQELKRLYKPDRNVFGRLVSWIWKGHEDENESTNGDGTVGFPLKFGPLNLLVFRSEELFLAWLRGTNECLQKTPRTRDEAIAIIKKYRSK